MTTTVLAALLLAGATAGCGGEQAGDDADAGDLGCGGGANIPPAQRYMPLEVGRSWTYQVTIPGAPGETKTQAVEAKEDVGGAKAGVTAFRLRTTKPDGITVSWQEDDGGCVIRHREQDKSLADALLSDQIYTPYKLRLDETAAHLTMGAQWTTTYSEITTDPGTGQTTTLSKSETWTVEAVDEQVTVPAGTFTCLRIHRTGVGAGQSDKMYWFAKGVGKVKETGDQTEELMSMTSP